MDFSFYKDLFSTYAPITEEEFQLLENNLKENSFRKNSFLLRTGDTQKSCYFLVHGIVMSYQETDTKTHVQAFAYAPGLAAVPQSFLKQRPSEFYLKAMSNVTALELSFEKLEAVMKKSRNLETAFRKMTEDILIGVLNRNTEINTLTIEQRFKNFTNRSAHLMNKIPHKYLASYLNIDPTNFSKLYNTILI